MLLELGQGAYFLRLVGWILWGLLAIGLIAALWIPQRRKHKALWALVALSPLILLFGSNAFRGNQFRQLQAEGERRFQEHCKTAGVRIYKTVPNVEGVLLAKRRPSNDWSNADQYALTDPYGADLTDDGYAESMLWGRNERGAPMSTASGPLGYRYVVMFNADGQHYTRYELTGTREREAVEVRRLPATSLPRYAVSFQDLSSREDRDYWIAGSRLFITDTQTGEVLAERIGWMFDRGLGIQRAQRNPWAFARSNACPAFRTINGGYPQPAGQTRDFVESVLIPLREPKK